MERCVGAFRRGCVILTDRILCDGCWREIDRAEGLSHPRFSKRYWLTPKGWQSVRNRIADPYRP